MTTFFVRNRASIWLSFLIAIVAATMMHPSFASMVSMVLIGALLVALRAVAHIEGRALAREGAEHE